MKTLPRLPLILAAVVLLAIAGLIYQALSPQGPDRNALLEAGIVLLPQPREVPEVTLTDQRGQPFVVGDSTGQWSLVFFGYTFCPDICPTTLAELRKLERQLPEATGARTRVLMVSVDPNRDSPQRLAEYLAYFNPDFTGLTGELEQIQTLSNALGIPFIPGDTTRENYTVDHSGNLAILGPDGRLQGFVRAPLKVEALAEQLPALVASEPAS